MKHSVVDAVKSERGVAVPGMAVVHPVCHWRHGNSSCRKQLPGGGASYLEQRPVIQRHEALPLEEVSAQAQGRIRGRGAHATQPPEDLRAVPRQHRASAPGVRTGVLPTGTQQVHRSPPCPRRASITAAVPPLHAASACQPHSQAPLPRGGSPTRPRDVTTPRPYFGVRPHHGPTAARMSHPP